MLSNTRPSTSLLVHTFPNYMSLTGKRLTSVWLIKDFEIHDFLETVTYHIKYKEYTERYGVKPWGKKGKLSKKICEHLDRQFPSTVANIFRNEKVM